MLNELDRNNANKPEILLKNFINKLLLFFHIKTKYIHKHLGL